MDGRARFATVGFLAVAGTLLVPLVLVFGAAFTLRACSDAGDLSVTNAGDSDVTVLTGDEEVTVPASGGVVLLDYGCTPGDVTVEFPSGGTVVMPGPVCPDQEIVVGDGTARLTPVAADGT